MIYLFDVDGTLTPSRQKIDPEFKSFFLDWITGRDVYLVSGSDYIKTVEQVGPDIVSAVNGCFNSSGNVGYVKGQRTYQNDWDYPESLIHLLNAILTASPYEIRAGNHIEIRIGMINFSVVGRSCTFEQRKAYHRYDTIEGERKSIARQIMGAFPDIEAAIGGEISVDLYPKGLNKGQILQYFSEPIHFFGDRTMKGGNDYNIAKQLQTAPNRVSQVSGWKETRTILKEIEGEK